MIDVRQRLKILGHPSPLPHSTEADHPSCMSRAPFMTAGVDDQIADSTGFVIKIEVVNLADDSVACPYAVAPQILDVA